MPSYPSARIIATTKGAKGIRVSIQPRKPPMTENSTIKAISRNVREPEPNLWTILVMLESMAPVLL